MRYLFILLTALAFVWAGSAEARTVKEMGDIMKKPIELKASNSPRFNVTFNHSSHRNTPCQTCHHEEGSGGLYVPCTECHNEPGPGKTDPTSTYMAFHSRSSTRSCLGCHTKLFREDKATYGKFINCRPCHLKRAADTK